MKKVMLGVVVVLFIGAQAWALGLPKVPSAPSVPTGNVTTSTPSTTTAATGGGGSKVVDALKACCNEVRYTDTNVVHPKKALAKMEGCIKENGTWQTKKYSSENSPGDFDMLWWQGDKNSCIETRLSCRHADKTDGNCGSCTVVPKKGMKCGD